MKKRVIKIELEKNSKMWCKVILYYKNDKYILF